MSMGDRFDNVKRWSVEARQVADIVPVQIKRPEDSRTLSRRWPARRSRLCRARSPPNC
jgi:antitoxin (DNA-binding transcriptional repressor) of toxin-antitoxin stability system